MRVVKFHLENVDIDDTAELFTEEVEVEPEEIVDNIILTKDDDDSAENAVTNK